MRGGVAACASRLRTRTAEIACDGTYAPRPGIALTHAHPHHTRAQRKQSMRVMPSPLLLAPSPQPPALALPSACPTCMGAHGGHVPPHHRLHAPPLRLAHRKQPVPLRQRAQAPALRGQQRGGQAGGNVQPRPAASVPMQTPAQQTRALRGAAEITAAEQGRAEYLRTWPSAPHMPAAQRTGGHPPTCTAR